MREPNLFIVGAGKAGTTALYSYLRSHPNIFMSQVKEPGFFSLDFPKVVRKVTTLEEYLKLFAGANSRHIAIGEASPSYMVSRVAIFNIYALYPHAKLVVLVRNPIDVAQSRHLEAVFNFNDDEESFEKAWHLQETRRRGENIPSTCRHLGGLQYAEVSKLGEQVERILHVFPREQVKIILFEDFINSPLSVYRDVLEFLGIPYDGRTEFPAVNPRRALKNKALARFILMPPRFIEALVVLLRKLFRTQHLGIQSFMTRFIKKKVERQPISIELRREMVETFREDIELLSRILDRDLSHWLA